MRGTLLGKFGSSLLVRRWANESSKFRLQSIADARFRDEQDRLGGIGFQLFAEAGQVDTEVVRLLFGTWPPDFSQDELMRQNLAGVLREEAQH